MAAIDLGGWPKILRRIRCLPVIPIGRSPQEDECCYGGTSEVSYRCDRAVGPGGETWRFVIKGGREAMTSLYLLFWVELGPPQGTRVMDDVLFAAWRAPSEDANKALPE